MIQEQKQQHSQSYYGHFESQMVQPEQMISLHSAKLHEVYPQTAQQTLEPPQIMMVDQGSSSNGGGGGPIHQSRGPSMGPRQANLSNSGANSKKHQGNVHFQIAADAAQQQHFEMPDQFE